MKLKEVFYLLGLKPRIKYYGCHATERHTPDGESVKWAVWEHPKAGHLAPDFQSIPFLRRLLRENDVCIDIGAHVGDTTIAPALVLGKKGLVIALEPNPGTFPVLQRNAELNADTMNIHAVNAAAMEQDGTYTFKYGDAGLFNGGAQQNISKWQHASAFEVEVKGVNLLSYIRANFPGAENRVRFIKMDTEGHDYTVFKTIRPIVEKSRPVLECEINRNMHLSDKEGLLSDLLALNYRLFQLALDIPSAERNEILDSTSLNLTERRTFDILAVPVELSSILS